MTTKVFQIIFSCFVLFVLLLLNQQCNGSAIELVQFEQNEDDAIKVQHRHAHNINDFNQIQQQKQQLQQEQHHVQDQQQQQPPQQRRRHESYDKRMSDDFEGNDLFSLNNDELDANDVEENKKHAEEKNNADTGIIESKKRERRQVSDWLIAPNTRWCGRGNIANGTYNHLGGASSADKCCRKHDHCKYFIPAMSNRYELFNYRPYTLSHCACDRRFRTCLKMANDEDANTIGKLFFNMVQTQCFVMKQEHVCQERSDDGKGSCQREIVRHKAYLKNNKKF